MSDDLLPITLDDMIAEVKRELGLRTRLYPQWKQGASNAKQRAFDLQYATMEAVLRELEARKAGVT